MTEKLKTIEDRLRLLIVSITTRPSMWKELEELTGIPSSSWVDFNRGKKRATAAMVEAVCQHSPHYALWLTTGTDAPELGQESPESPYRDSIIGNKYDVLACTNHYLKLRVQASKIGTKHAKGMAEAYKQLAIDELQYFFNGGPTPDDHYLSDDGEKRDADGNLLDSSET